MAIPPNAATAAADTAIDLAALQAAANAYFIDQATLVINQAIAQGKSIIYVTTFDNCDIIGLMNYFTGLGYKITFPDLSSNNPTGLSPFGPSNLFGPDWQTFWVNGGLIPPPVNPTRMGISWVMP